MSSNDGAGASFSNRKLLYSYLLTLANTPVPETDIDFRHPETKQGYKFDWERPKSYHNSNIHVYDENNNRFNADHTQKDTVIRNEVFDYMMKTGDFRYVNHEIEHMLKRDRKRFLDMHMRAEMKNNYGTYDEAIKKDQYIADKEDSEDMDEASIKKEKYKEGLLEKFENSYTNPFDRLS